MGIYENAKTRLYLVSQTGGGGRGESSFTISAFPSGDISGRLFINARDARIDKQQARQLRDYLNAWLGESESAAGESVNLNAKMIEAIKNIKEK